MGLARDYMFRLHRDNIKDLTTNFPENAKKDGKPFWSKRRRYPQSADYDPKKEKEAAEENNLSMSTQTRYIMCVANILAVNFGLQPEPDSTTPETLVPAGHTWRSSTSNVTALTGKPMRKWVFSGEKSQTNEDDDSKEKEMKENEEAIVKEFNEITSMLSTMNVSELKFVEADFEKDLDANFHIDFIWSSTNLRAWNYQLELATRHKVKMIAGKIIPAILTATASICVLMTLEILKIIKGIDDLSKYKNSTCNLGVNMYQFMEPGEVQKHDGQKKAADDLASAERNYTSTMERMKKKHDEDKTKITPRDLQTIANVVARKASMES